LTSKRSSERSSADRFRSWPVFEVRPGTGLGPLRFGMSIPDVERILGTVAENEAFEDGDVHLTYPEVGVSLFFSAEEENRLSGMEVDGRCPCTLFGEEVFAKSRRAVIELMGSRLPGSERRPDPPVVHLEAGGSRVSYRGLAMDFYFDETGQLQEINWGPLSEKDGEE
jgi:hypothetical protein